MYDILTTLCDKYGISAPDDVRMSILLPLIGDLLHILAIPTRRYCCEDCKNEITFICPKVKKSITLTEKLKREGLSPEFVAQVKNIKACIFPAFAYRDYDDNNKYTFFSYNILNEIVGTQNEPHKDTTLCRVCMKRRFIKAVEDAEPDSTLPPSVVLMEKHLQDYSQPLSVTSSQTYRATRRVL